MPEIESSSPLSQDIATFLETRACLVLSAASESLIPELCLGVACLVSPDRLRVRVVASIEPLPGVERTRVAESVARMRPEFDKIGFHDPYAVTLLDYDPNELVCVGLTPTAVFDQTPGPLAGQPIDPGAGRRR